MFELSVFPYFSKIFLHIAHCIVYVSTCAISFYGRLDTSKGFKVMCTHKVYCQILSLAQCQQFSRHLAWFQWRLMCVYICTLKVVFQDNSFGHSCRVKTKQSLLWNWLHVFSIKMKIFLLFIKDVKWCHKLLIAGVRPKKMRDTLYFVYTQILTRYP